MKTIIFELFSGVGLCNQLFSLETAIYLAHISQRKRDPCTTRAA